VVKVLSQGGRSLADQYDVVGSVAGIEQLDSREVTLVHEMGATLFSERFRTTIRRIQSGSIAQSSAWSVSLTNLPTAITRLIGISVFADDGSRVSNAALFASNPTVNTEFPIWVWNGTSREMRHNDFGVGVATFDTLIGEPSLQFVPTFIGGEQQGSQPVKDLVFRGITTGFGAGTVDITALFFMAFNFTGGVSAFGAQVPSW